MPTNTTCQCVLKTQSNHEGPSVISARLETSKKMATLPNGTSEFNIPNIKFTKLFINGDFVDAVSGFSVVSLPSSFACYLQYQLRLILAFRMYDLFLLSVVHYF